MAALSSSFLTPAGSRILSNSGRSATSAALTSTAGFVRTRVIERGALVVDVGGRVVFHRVATSLSDHADGSDVVEAVLGLALRTSTLRV